MVVTQTNFFPHIPQTGKILEERFLLPDLLVSMTYGRLVPFFTKPLETSTWEAMKVCGGAALLLVSPSAEWWSSMAGGGLSW